MTFDKQDPASLSGDDKKKYLFLRQLETLSSFLANGAISLSQYEFSYNGLVTKMGITEEELSSWLTEYEKLKEKCNET